MSVANHVKAIAAVLAFHFNCGARRITKVSFFCYSFIIFGTYHVHLIFAASNSKLVFTQELHVDIVHLLKNQLQQEPLPDILYKYLHIIRILVQSSNSGNND